MIIMGHVWGKKLPQSDANSASEAGRIAAMLCWCVLFTNCYMLSNQLVTHHEHAGLVSLSLGDTRVITRSDGVRFGFNYTAQLSLIILNGLLHKCRAERFFVLGNIMSMSPAVNSFCHRELTHFLYYFSHLTRADLYFFLPLPITTQSDDCSGEYVSDVRAQRGFCLDSSLIPWRVHQLIITQRS